MSRSFRGKELRKGTSIKKKTKQMNMSFKGEELYKG
jgi:hypothetical protein